LEYSYTRIFNNKKHAKGASTNSREWYTNNVIWTNTLNDEECKQAMQSVKKMLVYFLDWCATLYYRLLTTIHNLPFTNMVDFYMSLVYQKAYSIDGYMNRKRFVEIYLPIAT
jgi:hypothetical protein